MAHPAATAPLARAAAWSLALLAAAAGAAASIALLRVTLPEGALRPSVDHALLCGAIATSWGLGAGAACIGRWREHRRPVLTGASAARAAGARPHEGAALTEERARNIAEEISIAAAWRTPATLWVAPQEHGINVVAVGTADADAAVIITQGALNRLERGPLQGAIAQALARLTLADHGAEQDCARALAMAAAIAWIGSILVVPWWTNAKGETRGVPLMPLPILPLGIGLLLAGGILALAAWWVRTRQDIAGVLGADRRALDWLKDPAALAEALRVVRSSPLGARLSSAPLRSFGTRWFADSTRSRLAVASRYPTLEARIRALDPSWDGSDVAAHLTHAAILEQARQRALATSTGTSAALHPSR